MNNRLFPASKADAPIGTVLYRNRDVERDALLGGVTAKRLIDIDLRLRRASTSLCLEVESEGGCKVEVAVEAPWQAAKLPQAEQRRRVMSKLGDTRFAMHRYDDMLDDMEFVPASVLADLRRQAIEALDSTMRATYRYENRRPENREAVLPWGPALTYHDNVANSLAEEFYRSHGATDIERAIETRKSAVADGTVVMTTRYCLRRELGACLREKCSKTLPQPLYLQNRAARYALRFDCALCQMQLLKA